MIQKKYNGKNVHAGTFNQYLLALVHKRNQEMATLMKDLDAQKRHYTRLNMELDEKVIELTLMSNKLFQFAKNLEQFSTA